MEGDDLPQALVELLARLAIGVVHVLGREVPLRRDVADRFVITKAPLEQLDAPAPRVSLGARALAMQLAGDLDERPSPAAIEYGGLPGLVTRLLIKSNKYL